MSRGERLLAAGFVLGLVSLLAWIGGEAWQAQRFTQRQELPDGSTVELRAVTSGPVHRCYCGTPAQRLLRKIVPARFGRWVGGAEVQHLGPKDSVIFWIARRPEDGGWFAGHGTVAVAINDRGQEGGVGDWVAAFRGGSDELSAVELTDFDRRSKTVGLRIYEQRGEQRTRVAEFKASNPLF